MALIEPRYFASLRERLGIDDEVITLPDEIDTVAGLQHWLQDRGEPWFEALADRRLRARRADTFTAPAAGQTSPGAFYVFQAPRKP